MKKINENKELKIPLKRMDLCIPSMLSRWLLHSWYTSFLSAEVKHHDLLGRLLNRSTLHSFQQTPRLQPKLPSHIFTFLFKIIVFFSLSFTHSRFTSWFFFSCNLAVIKFEPTKDIIMLNICTVCPIKLVQNRFIKLFRTTVGNGVCPLYIIFSKNSDTCSMSSGSILIKILPSITFDNRINETSAKNIFDSNIFTEKFCSSCLLEIYFQTEKLLNSILANRVWMCN